MTEEIFRTNVASLKDVELSVNYQETYEPDHLAFLVGETETFLSYYDVGRLRDALTEWLTRLP